MEGAGRQAIIRSDTDGLPLPTNLNPANPETHLDDGQNLRATSPWKI